MLQPPQKACPGPKISARGEPPNATNLRLPERVANGFWTPSERLLNAFWTGTGWTGYGYGFRQLDLRKNVAFFQLRMGSERVPTGPNGLERVCMTMNC